MRRLALVLGLCAALVPAAGWAVCNKSNVCSAAPLVNDPACCGATLCTIDGTVTVSGSTCTFDFDGRRLAVSGQLVVGSRDVLLKANRVEVTGKIDARGTPGGNVTIQTTGSVAAPLNAFSMSGGPATQIDVSGSPPASGGRAAGSVVVQADGPITLAGSGSILANALDASSDGGVVLIQSSAGATSIDVTLSANAGLNGLGGAVIIDAPAGLQLTGTVNANGQQGSIDVGAAGALSVGGGARLSANALGGSGSDGGAIDISAASVDMRGILEAMGGSDPTGDIGGSGGTLSIVANAGPLNIVRTTLAISVSGAPGADGGEIELSTNSQATGDITINAPIEAIGRGGVGLLLRTSAGGIISANSSRSLFVKRNINAMGSGDLGGELELVARGDFALTTGSLNVNDLSGSGFVSIEATEGDVTIDGNVQAKASSNGEGGSLDITAGNDLAVAGTRLIDASGATNGRGGSIDLRAGRHITIGRLAELHANAGTVAGTSGGNVSLFAGSRLGDPGLPGNLTIDGIVTATGRPPISGTSFLNGSIDLGGCAVLLSATAFVDSTGDTASTNRVTARTSLRVNVGGKLKATGSNVAIYPVGTPPVTGANTVDPPFTGACPGGCARAICTGSGDAEGCLVPCPNCGNGTREFPESPGCDPPGCNHGCDSHCRRLPNGSCDDGKPCTTDSCDSDPDFGCRHEERDGQPCDNGTVCDGREVCLGDVCDPGEPLDCDDGNPCTAETCSATGGCSDPTPLTGNPPGCDNACVERCMVSGPNSTCTPITPPNCNDNNPNTNDFCDPADGTCHHEAGAPCTSTAQCNDNNPCTVDTCPEGALRFCHNEPLGNGTPCPNSTVCDGGETCLNGSCQPGTSLDCDDQDACTDDACDPVAGCSNTDIPNCCETVGDCNDSNPCTNDTCESRSCVNIPDPGCCATDADCNDNNPCTDDSLCVSQRCTHTPVTGNRPGCGDACRAGTCQAGTCQLSDPIVCNDDGDVCTDDFCDGDTGCVHLAIPQCCRGDVAGECGDVCSFCDTESHRCERVAGCRTCTRDSDCDPDGRCAGRACGTDGICADAPAVECTDGNPETSDVCRLDANDQPVCDHRCLTARVCDDGNACNGAETCSSGACVPGTAPSCDDGDPCTDNTCVAPGGCQNPAKTGFPSARCRFERLRQALAGATATDIAAPIRSKIEKLLGAAGTNLDAAEGASTPKKAKRKLSAVRKQLKKIGKVVRGALRKRKISAPLADVILSVVDDGVQAVDGLRTP